MPVSLLSVAPAWLAPLCLALALSGCGGLRTATAPPALPGGLPTEWAGASADSPPATTPKALLAWWQQFNDPLLTDLVRQALAANTGVRSAQAALRQARALQDVAAAGLGPTLTAGADAQRARSAGNTGNRFGASLDASWELDLFGGRRSALDARSASAEASAADLGTVQVSLAAEVALAYIGLRNAQGRVAIAEANLASQQETLQIVRWRQQAGLADGLATAQALAAAEQTRAVLPLLQTTVAQSRHALAVLTGQPPAALDTRLANAKPVPQPAATLALAGPADTLRQRPDVRAAERRLAAAWATLDQADAALRPSLRLGGSLGLSALTLSGLGQSAAVAGSLLAGLSLPVFDGGALRGQQRAQQAALDQAQEAWRASVLTALQEVEDALVALANDQARQQRLQAAAQAATNAATLAGQRYRSGLVDFQTVLDTQRSQLAAQDSLAGASADIAAAHVRLYKSLGGGWVDDLATTGTTTETTTTATTAATTAAATAASTRAGTPASIPTGTP